jgi:alkanesulfonate monooxygenase SsuD/methylene tetrahydromethanopterin reductase-like flavin-dependent oxidoreductase (luciferase family)
MTPGQDHPFCVDVRSVRTSPGRFGWRIASRHDGVWRSASSYPSFDEALSAAREKLAEVVAAWRDRDDGA